MKHHELKVGGLYSVNDGEGNYRVAKILALDDSAVHIRLYKTNIVLVQLQSMPHRFLSGRLMIKTVLAWAICRYPGRFLPVGSLPFYSNPL